MNRIIVSSVVAAVLACAGCAKSNDPEALQREAAAIAVAAQPKLDALVARVRALQRDLRGNLPGWQDMLRTAELANDQLGLPPFTQTVAPGPGWKPNPTTLLGMGGYVRGRAEELVRAGQRRELQFLVDDERRRYEQGIADVDRYLSQVEHWLAPALAPTRARPEASQ
jgi:hypothetical protein